MVTAVLDPRGERGKFVLRPHMPLSLLGTLGVFAIVSLPIIAVAVTCGLLGCWYVLPFSLLVVAAVAAGLGAGYRHTQFHEIVSIRGEAVAVDKGHRHPEEHYEFPRGWAQIVLQEPAADDRFSHLFIRSHGHQVELGEFLDEPERHYLATTLRGLMGPGRSMASFSG